MTTFTFEADKSEVEKIRTILKALGVKKLKVKEDVSESAEKIKYSRKEFGEMLDESKKSKSDKLLNSKDDVKNLFDSL
ncbi:hypothetical protein [Epilithonimonas hungarica]|uniref:Uncharacterized protein n=1 Tax=Epilithonimonas hungarica TaxID=454006 RepID=A0A1G7I6U8_9FLAO|nr:hypothetical protein [Epilithonimonas hungarica]PZU89667.1 MAG: hypothetical protein DI529_03930 [Chryseobacterium sp.]SDF08405.1 hypothetical protein SAMN05421825_1001 [Epilithonimonas hungarica]